MKPVELTASGRRACTAAPAKINLYLKVLGRRPDGYHELDSLMARLELADDVRVEFGGAEDALESAAKLSGPLPPDFDGPGNLILAALRAFREASRGWPRAGVSIRVRKNIPLGAGLGGGSSDCAALLNVLNNQSPAPLSAGALNELGQSLGADVPFFLQKRVLARARGVGERLNDAPQGFDAWAGRAVILVNPGLFVSTGKVFQTLGLTNAPSNNNLGPMSLPEPGENDLFRAAVKVEPALTAAAESIQSLAPIHWGLSGSGATFWLLSEAPDRDCQNLKAIHPTWWIQQTAIAAAK